MPTTKIQELETRLKAYRSALTPKPLSPGTSMGGFFAQPSKTQPPFEINVVVLDMLDYITHLEARLKALEDIR